MARANVAGSDSNPPPVGDVEVAMTTARATSVHRRDAMLAASIVVAVLAALVIGYLASTVPGSWFPRAAPKSWQASDLSVVRGTGRIGGDGLIVSAPDPNGIALVTVKGDLRASDYAAVAWNVTGLGDDADVRLLWSSDVRPDKLNSTPVQVAAGGALVTIVANNPGWLGHIKGLALAIHDPLARPVQVRGVTATPMGAAEIVRDRFKEWFQFEPWNGASINTVVGGAEHQEVPLPAFVALVVGLAGIIVVAIARWRPATFSAATPGILAAFFLAGWLMLDARWTWNLLRQEHATAAQFGGKDARDKHLATEDGALFAFVEKARAVLPQTPVRIVIASDADYFRGRAAYHLYPHSVLFNPHSNELPAATIFHSGDWLLVFQRRGIQFDKTQGKIRWEGGQTVNAELKLVEPGAALFVIR